MPLDPSIRLANLTLPLLLGSLRLGHPLIMENPLLL